MPLNEPPIDELIKKAGSRFALCRMASERATQINAYYSQLSEGKLENVGPLVDSDPKENIINVAFREIGKGYVSPQEGVVKKTSANKEEETKSE